MAFLACSCYTEVATILRKRANANALRQRGAGPPVAVSEYPPSASSVFRLRRSGAVDGSAENVGGTDFVSLRSSTLNEGQS